MTVQETKLVEDFFRKSYTERQYHPKRLSGSVGACVNMVEAARRGFKCSVNQWLCRAYLTMNSQKNPRNIEKFALLVNASFLRRSK